MKQALRKCANPECGLMFLPQHPCEKYCSRRCLKRVDRMHFRNKVVYHREPVEGRDIILREFYCRHCDRLVQVCDESDKRTVFCCQACERKYWKRPPERRHRGDSNRGMSGGMSLGSLIRREKHNLTH